MPKVEAGVPSSQISSLDIELFLTLVLRKVKLFLDFSSDLGLGYFFKSFVIVNH